MPIRDRMFQSTFSRMFVYNILFEDAEIDEKFLGMNEESTVLSITGAGCGVAGMVSRHPRQIDAVDINKHHLALTALKVQAARNLQSHSDFYDLCARGRSPTPERTVRRLTEDLPRWMQRYWKLHYRRFNKPYQTHGLTGKVMTELRKRVGTDADWLREMATRSTADRLKVVDDWFVPVLNQPHVKAFLNSPVQLLGLGVNFEQRDRILETEGTDLMGFFVTHLKRVAVTDLMRNWFAWYVLVGQFNHDQEDGVPPLPPPGSPRALPGGADHRALAPHQPLRGHAPGGPPHLVALHPLRCPRLDAARGAAPPAQRDRADGPPRRHHPASHRRGGGHGRAPGPAEPLRPPQGCLGLRLGR